MDTLFTQLIDVFNWIVRSSAYAAVTIAVVALVQFAGRRLLPARWLYALWLILLVRMVLPFGPESRLSLWNFLPKAAMQDGFVSSSEVLTITTETSGSGKTLNRSVPANPKSPGISLPAALSLIWLAGTLVMLAVIAVNNFRLWRSVRKLRQATEQSMLELFEDCKQLMRVRTVVGLAITDRVKSPSLFGCLRPRVLLPAEFAERIQREELRFIFLHELAHLKQRDIWTGWIVALLQSLHWFNPLVWWAFARMRADREVACDALALSRARNEDKEMYGGALVGLLERFQYSRRLPVVAGILENKAQLKRRLNMITGFKHSTRREIAAAAALFAVLSITLLTNPKALLSQSGEFTDDPSVRYEYAESNPAPSGKGFSFSFIMGDGQAFTGVMSDSFLKSPYYKPGSLFEMALALEQYMEASGDGFIGDSWVRRLTETEIEALRARADQRKLIKEAFRYQDATPVEGFVDPVYVPGYLSPVRVGGAIMQRMLIHKVEPNHIGISEGLSGEVVLDVTVEEEGTVTKINVKRGTTGDSRFRVSAMEAVKQWRYNVFMLNGNPVPVEFEVRIAFLPDGTVDTGSRP